MRIGSGAGGCLPAGTWWHAGFHLTTAIVGPTVLTLPYALRGMGWGLGLTLLSVMAAVTFYEYSLMSRVLDHCEARGRRHIRFRELAADVLGTHPTLTAPPSISATRPNQPPPIHHTSSSAAPPTPRVRRIAPRPRSGRATAASMPCARSRAPHFPPIPLYQQLQLWRAGVQLPLPINQ